MTRALLALLLASTAPALATGLEVSGSAQERGSVRATVTWDNAWKNARNRDGVWLFVKLTQDWRRQHARLAPSGHQVTPLAGRPPGELLVSEDRAGAFLSLSGTHRGAAGFSVKLALEPDALAGFAADKPVEAVVYGVEMVYLPEGAFTLGAPDARALDESGFFKTGAEGAVDGLYEVTSEKAIPVGRPRGRLDYRVRFPEYEGDRLGPIPEGFPKGFRAFWLMKYELSQGDYAAFLNALDGEATAFRAIQGGRDYAKGRGSIVLEAGRYVARSPRRPANWVSWDDGCAFADWAGLRPYTELEWEKAARGPGKPVDMERPWGSASVERLRRRVRPDDDLETGGEADEKNLSDETRDVLGASYWWVLDLAGSLWERVVTAGHPAGRAFRGTHGDGTVPHGFADNADWPKGDVGRGGFGYRGGGYYEHGFRQNELNPWSPIAWRRYAAWGDAPRTIAYGFRAARSETGGTRQATGSPGPPPQPR